MAVTGQAYGLGVQKITAGTLVWMTATLKGALVQSAYTPNIDTDEFWSTPQANEASGTGYTAGGITLASKTNTYNSTGVHQVQLDAADLSWASSTVTAGYLVVYSSTGVAATSPLLGYIAFGQDLSTANGTFTIQFDATGVVVFAV